MFFVNPYQLWYKIHAICNLGISATSAWMYISNFCLFTNLQSPPGFVGTCNILLVNQLYDIWQYSPFMSNYETQIVAGITVIDVSFSGTSFDNSYDLSTFCAQCKQQKSFTWIWSHKRQGLWQRIWSVRGSWRGEQGTKWVPWNSSHCLSMISTHLSTWYSSHWDLSPPRNQWGCTWEKNLAKLEGSPSLVITFALCLTKLFLRKGRVAYLLTRHYPIFSQFSQKSYIT